MLPATGEVVEEAGGLATQLVLALLVHIVLPSGAPVSLLGAVLVLTVLMVGPLVVVVAGADWPLVVTTVEVTIVVESCTVVVSPTNTWL
jgi:hypothetical protein